MFLIGWIFFNTLYVFYKKTQIIHLIKVIGMDKSVSQKSRIFLTQHFPANFYGVSKNFFYSCLVPKLPKIVWKFPTKNKIYEFWRPTLYQLSYTPKVSALLYMSRKTFNKLCYVLLEVIYETKIWNYRCSNASLWT